MDSPNRPKLTRFCVVLPSSLVVAVADTDARQACDLFARKERGRFARRAQILRRRRACRLRM